MFDNFKFKAILLFVSIAIALALAASGILQAEVEINTKIASVSVVMLAIAFIVELGVPKEIKKKARAMQGINFLEGESKFQDMVEGAPDPILTLDAKGYITFVNKTAETVFGCKKREITGRHFAEAGIFSPNSLPSAVKQFTTLMSGNIVKPYKAEFLRKNSSSFTGEVNHRPIIIEGKVMGVEIIIRYWGEKKQR